MGVTISKGTLAPISFASTIIGFVSFAVTVATLLRVSWDNLATISAAPTEIPDLLGNLKAGLYEERRNLRRTLRWQRRRRRSTSGRRGEKDPQRTTREDELGDQTTIIMRDTIRHLLQRFRALERPFLADDAAEKRKKARRGEIDHEDWDTDGQAFIDPESGESSYLRNEYRYCGLRERWYWLHRKSTAMDMLTTLSRLQTRRIAKDISDMHMTVAHMERDWRHLDDRMWTLENRLSRVVGVRRVE